MLAALGWGLPCQGQGGDSEVPDALFSPASFRWVLFELGAILLPGTAFLGKKVPSVSTNLGVRLGWRASVFQMLLLEGQQGEPGTTEDWLCFVLFFL